MAGPTAFLVSNNTTLVIDGETGLTRGITITRAARSTFRIFQIYPGCNVTLDGLTVSNGSAVGGAGASSAGIAGAGGGAAGMGGAIYNQGTLKIQDSTLSGNSAIGGAGGNGNSGSTTGGGGGGGGGLGGPGGTGGTGNVYGGSVNESGGNGGGPNGGPGNAKLISGAVVVRAAPGAAARAVLLPPRLVCRFPVLAMMAASAAAVGAAA